MKNVRTTTAAIMLLVAALLLTACGKDSTTPENNTPPNMSLSSNSKLGPYEMDELACFDDGLIRFYYDGNFFLPAQLVNPDENFSEITIIQADLEQTEKNVAYGYFYYAVGEFDEEFSYIVEQEEDIALTTVRENLTKTEYLPGTDNFLGYKYEYTSNGTPMYAIITVRNEADGDGCYVAAMSSDMPEAIDKAIEMFSTVEVYGTEQTQEKVDESFRRTDDLYTYLVGPVEAPESSEELLEELAQPKSLFFTEGIHELTAGEKYTPELAGEAAGEPITYLSTNEAVATVDAQGEVTAIAEGVSIVVANTADGATTSIYIKVHPVEEGSE